MAVWFRVYTYRTSGYEHAYALGGRRHDYPRETTITYTADPCGVRARWAPLEDGSREVAYVGIGVHHVVGQRRYAVVRPSGLAARNPPLARPGMSAPTAVRGTCPACRPVRELLWKIWLNHGA